MFKRILLFMATNVLVVVTISILLRVLGIGNYLTPYGLDYGSLMAFCLVWGMVGAFISLAISRIVAKFMMGVKVIDPKNPGQFAGLVSTVHALAQKAGLPAMPEVGVYDSHEVNAFATGPTRSRSLVAVSTGLLQRMDKDAVEGVLGHEVAHIANGDMVTMTLIQGVVNAFVMFFARVIAFGVSQGVKEENRRMVSFMVTMVLEMILGLFGYMVVAWFSRRREFRADYGGAAYAGKSRMIGALQALNRAHGRQEDVEEAQNSVATLKISGKSGGFMALLSTHPPLEDRIARLQMETA